MVTPQYSLQWSDFATRYLVGCVQCRQRNWWLSQAKFVVGRKRWQVPLTLWKKGRERETQSSSGTFFLSCLVILNLCTTSSPSSYHQAGEQNFLHSIIIDQNKRTEFHGSSMLTLVIWIPSSHALAARRKFLTFLWWRIEIKVLDLQRMQCRAGNRRPMPAVCLSSHRSFQRRRNQQSLSESRSSFP
jgi:hypothetical protein